MRLLAARFAVGWQRCSAPAAMRSSHARGARDGASAAAELLEPALQRGRPRSIGPLQAACQPLGQVLLPGTARACGMFASRRPFTAVQWGREQDVLLGKMLRSLAAQLSSSRLQLAVLKWGKMNVCAVSLKFSILENSLRLIYFSSLCLKLYCMQ